MQLVAQVKLQPSPEQATALKRTLEATNAACNYASGIAWQTKQFRQYDLHHAVYYALRERFGLSAQAVGSATAPVPSAFVTLSSRRPKGLSPNAIGRVSVVRR